LHGSLLCAFKFLLREDGDFVVRRRDAERSSFGDVVSAEETVDDVLFPLFDDFNLPVQFREVFVQIGEVRSKGRWDIEDLTGNGKFGVYGIFLSRRRGVQFCVFSYDISKIELEFATNIQSLNVVPKYRFSKRNCFSPNNPCIGKSAITIKKSNYLGVFVYILNHWFWHSRFEAINLILF